MKQVVLRTRYTQCLLMSVGMLPVLIAAKNAHAHVSEQGFVLLLPTDLYIFSGVAAVVASILLLLLVPARVVEVLFKGRRLFSRPDRAGETVTSLLASGLLGLFIYGGLTGTRDPLENPLPLLVWTVWWIGLVSVQGLVGDIWRWINPWSGLYRLLRGRMDAPALVPLPENWGVWPGIAGFLGFAALLLVDLAPDDPARLAWFVLGYWLFTFAAMIIFGGRDWLRQGEFLSILMGHYSASAPVGAKDGKLSIGLPGWQLLNRPTANLSSAVFILFLLATGTFDGLNETFWWLAQIGINPLEFPGRSAVVLPNFLGLIISNILLVLIFATTIYAGLLFIGETSMMAVAFGRLVHAILPIALAYHAAHYLISFLVSGQYVLAVLNDPFDNGASLLGLGNYLVTTGFLNSRDSVEVIWLTQAGLIVAGHIVSVLIAHGIAVDLFRDNRRALLSQIPLALFMVVYTFAGLTLLASPRGA